MNFRTIRKKRKKLHDEIEQLKMVDCGKNKSKSIEINQMIKKEKRTI